MNKVQSIALILMVTCLLCALTLSVFFGIPFWSVPSFFDGDSMNYSRDFSPGYSITLSKGDNAAANILQQRIDAMPYNDVELISNPDGTFTIVLPRNFGTSAEEFAATVTARGLITYTDVNGKELIPTNAVSHALVGFGRMNPNSSTGDYYLEFFLKDEYREQFRNATADLALLKESGGNIVCIRLDGANILQATVDTAMTESSFMIGGSFPDAILPNLYVSFVNGGALEAELTYSDSVPCPPTLSEHALLLFCIGLIGLCLVVGIAVFIHRRLFAVSTLSLLLCYVGATFLIYQALNLRVSRYSMIGMALGILIITLVIWVLDSKICTETKNGKSIAASFDGGLRRSYLFFGVFHALFLLVSSVFLGVSAQVSNELNDLAICLFITALFSLVFSLVNARYYQAVFKNTNLLSAELFGISKDA